MAHIAGTARAPQPIHTISLYVEHQKDGTCGVFADGVLIGAHETRCQAEEHCLRLRAQQDADRITA